jgi:CRP-like cAMP-binding protein
MKKRAPPRSTPLAPTSALDHALEALATGNADLALRWAVPALADEGSGAPAADLVGRALALAGRDELAIDAHELALKLLVRQGLAPHAVATALALRALTGRDDAIRTVASAFGADAPEGPEVRPPALESKEVQPLDSKLSREKLVQRAVAALAAAPRPAEAPAPHPRLPLWSALPRAAFERFARALTVRTCAPGEVLMREGEPGQSAFVVARGEVRVTRAGDEGESIELAVMGPGAIVGEMALVTAAPRAATVTATRGALVLEAPRAALDEAAAEVPEVGEQVVAFCRRRLVDNVLRTSPILREVPPEEREGLPGLFETRTFEPGERLITEGESGAGLHLLAAGEVEVLRTEEGGETLRLARLGPGSCVGEISLVLRRAANASVLATQPSVSLVLRADRFLEVIRDRPTLLARLYELAVQREDETLNVLAQSPEEIEDSILV